MRLGDNPVPLKVGDHTVVVDWPPNDHALFVCLGAALAQAQVFESTIAHFLSALDRKNQSTEHSCNFDELMEQNTSKTLGWLSQRLRDSVGDEALADALDEARVKRNFLVHNILKKYGWWAMNDESYIECINEVNSIRDTLSNAEREVIKRLQDTGALEVLAVSINPSTGEITEL